MLNSSIYYIVNILPCSQSSITIFNGCFLLYVCTIVFLLNLLAHLKSWPCIFPIITEIQIY